MLVHRHRVDGQVTATQIVFQRHIRRGMKRKPGVAAAALALGAGEGIFLFGPRVQEHREVLADGLESGGNHLPRRRANDHIVAVRRRQTKQPVAHRTTDEIGFHAAIIDGCNICCR